IFVEQPYFNEPCFEVEEGTERGRRASRDYNGAVRAKTVELAMLGQYKRATGRAGGMGAGKSAAAPDEATRADIHARATAELKRQNTGIAVAEKFEIDDIIDPADTRHFLSQTLKAMPTPLARSHRKHAIDAW
ncbi:MAG: hypothetical protein HOA21_00635, partial [Rhodospirillaceae bacterium]|nr:hypothetical protein [Rhodospirillaceae bacterium]